MRLLHGPDDHEALRLQGMMMGVREVLEEKNIEIKGVTGFWWFEELDETPKRGPSIEELIERHSNDERVPIIVKGSELAVQFIEDVLK